MGDRLRPALALLPAATWFARRGGLDETRQRYGEAVRGLQPGGGG